MDQEYDLEDIIFEPPFTDVVIKEKTKRFWVRPPTAIERQMCQAAARAQSAALRKAFHNHSSDQYKYIIKSQIDEINDDELRLLWVSGRLLDKIFEINRLSLENREEYYVPEPVGKQEGVIPPTSEEMEQYEEDKKQAELRRQEDIQKSTEQARTALETEAKSKDLKELRESVENIVIDQKCQEEWNAEFGLQLITRCTFLDKDLAKPAFKTEGVLRRLMASPDGLRLVSALRDTHMGLMLNVDQLKT